MSCRFDDSFQARPSCPIHVEFLDKNKFEKLVRLLVLLKKKVGRTVCYETDYIAAHLTFLTAVNVHDH
jgi:hypothetical protein